MAPTIRWTGPALYAPSPQYAAIIVAANSAAARMARA
jgi:hypothetical protein